MTDVSTTCAEAIFRVHLTLKMAAAQVVETSVTKDSPSQDSNHPHDLFQSRYKEECFIRYPNTEKWVEKTRHSLFFSTLFELFRAFDVLRKASIILREIQSKSSPNFMIIGIRYLTLLHGNEFLCFRFMN